MLKSKYRIKLKSNRIIGPFAPEQIGELFLKKHIDGTENAQAFPSGNWQPANDFPELLEQFTKIFAQKDFSLKSNTELSLSESISLPTRNTKDKLSLPEMNQLKSEEIKTPPIVKDNFKEFKFSIDESPPEIHVDYEQLEKNYQKEELVRRQDDALDKTRIKKINSLEPNVEKTIIRPNSIPFETDSSVIKKPMEVTPPQTPPIPFSSSDKTQAIALQDALIELKQKAEEAELEIEQKIINDNKEDEEFITTGDQQVQTPPVKNLPRKAMKPIVLLAFIAIFVVLLFPDNEQKLGDLKPEFSVISFPIPAKYEDSNKAANELKEGVKLYNHGTYKDRLKSAEKFRLSLEAKFQDNPQALGWLVLNYAEILPNANDKEKAITNLFRLIQLSRGKVIVDMNVAMGTAIFYGHIKKYATALTTIENFLRVKNKPSSKLFSIYLDLLIKNGRWIDAGKVFEQLSNIKDPPLDSYLPMSKFLSQAGKGEEAKILLEKGLQRFPNSVPLFLEYCSYLLSDQNFKKFEIALNNLKQVNSENAPTQVSKYLEFLGMQAIIKKNQEAAAAFFKKALAIQESDELRSKLSSLEIGGSKKVESLIRESKIIDLIGKSKNAENERRWDDAYKFAIDASDLAENYIPAQLWLSYIQTKRGYFNSAIQTLEKLQKDNPNNGHVNFSLISAYIEARKFDLVQRSLGQLSGSKLGRTSDFAFLMGSYYRKTNNYNLASKWFTTAVTINPVNDQAYYELAELLLEGKKFDRCRFYANKAIELDPENSTYHGLMAKILYDTENVDTAIGYLRDVLETKVDDPYLIGEIAIDYQRSGRMKEFEQYQKKFQEMPNPTSNFYEYMIYSSQLNESIDSVIKYSNELLKINPGSMEVRLTLGEFYLKKGNLKEALYIFESVKERLPSYPRVNYWIAKIYLLLKDYPKALAAGQDEIKYNPILEHGHYIVGETYKQQQKYPEALLSFEKALSLNGSSIETLFALAWIKHRQNYPNIARDFYAKILKLDPGNAEANKQMGLVFKDLGQGSLAIEYLKIYLDLNPGAEDRNQIESQIRQLQ